MPTLKLTNVNLMPDQQNDTTPVKIRVRSGEVEIEYDGPFGKLVGCLSAISRKINELPTPPRKRESGGDAAMAEGKGNDPDPDTPTMSEVANRLDVQSASDLTIAAAAKLALYDGETPFARKDILNAMRETPHYKESYKTNLSTNIKRLVLRGRLNKRGENQYALSAEEESQMRERLGLN